MRSVRCIKNDKNPHVFLHTSSTIVLKSEFNKTGGFPYGMKRNEDYAMFFSLALITTFIYTGFPLSIYVGGVQGQATSNNSKEIQEHIINRFNYTFRNWTKLGCSNSTFRIFLKYELRHYFISSLKIKDYETLNMFFNKLDSGIKKSFSSVEFFIMKRKYLNLLSILIILSSKIIWRVHSFPRFNES